MKNIIVLIVSVALCNSATSQDLLAKAFNNFVNSTWVCDTTWNNGQNFHQEITYQFDLDNKIVQAETIGFLDPAGNNIGKRNHGIRYSSEDPDTLNFIEFDVYGGATEGICFLIGPDLYYQYSYEVDLGTTIMTEKYAFINEETFEYTIGIFEEGAWTFKYLSAFFRKKD